MRAPQGLGIINDFLLNGNGLCLRFLFKAFHQLCFCFLSSQSGNFFKATNMLFLVFFQFGPFDINELDLAVQVLLNSLVFLNLFVQIGFFLVDADLFLFSPVLQVADFAVPVQHFLIMLHFQLYKFLFCFQDFFLFQGLCLKLGIFHQFLGLVFCIQDFLLGICFKNEFSCHDAHYKCNNGNNQYYYGFVH